MSSDKVKILISEPVDAETMEFLEKLGEIDVTETTTPREEIKERMKDATVYISCTDHVILDQDMLDCAPKLKHIARWGSGYNNVHVDVATSKGILVTNALGGNAVTMAEFTMGLMLAAARRVPQAIDASRRGKPERADFKGFELMGKSLGIIGVGNIGRELAKRAQAFGMKTFGYDLYAKENEFEMSGIEMIGYEELLKTCDVITVHVPYNKNTHHMFKKAEFDMMKNGVLFLNMARGGIVKEDDLINALNSGHLFGAALDVSEEEPISADNPLLHCENLLYVPHIGGQTPEAYMNIARIVCEEVEMYIKGGRPSRAINPQVFA